MKFSFLDKKGQSMTFSVLYGTFWEKSAIDDIFYLTKKCSQLHVSSLQNFPPKAPINQLCISCNVFECRNLNFSKQCKTFSRQLGRDDSAGASSKIGRNFASKSGSVIANTPSLFLLANTLKPSLAKQSTTSRVSEVTGGCSSLIEDLR